MSGLVRRLVPLALWLGLGLPVSGCGGGSPRAPGTTTVESPGSLRGEGPSLTGSRLDEIDESKSASAGLEGDAPFRFSEVARESGIDFVHSSGMTDQKYVPTAYGSGVAIFDHDNDGKLDLYFANGTFLPVGSKPTGPNRLYKNLGGGKFRDATQTSGLGFEGYCHGILTADIDNDGDQDVFLCNYGANALFLNRGDGTFQDISEAAGIDKPNWTTSGAFLDYDRDGDLDLYLANYGDWVIPRDDVFCGNKSKNVRTYCYPKWIRPTRHTLFRNDGNHTFSDVTDRAGIGRTDGHGFGVVAADLNDDGLTDLFVANDNDPNFTFLNRGDGTFEDVTLTSGAALTEQGRAMAGMGVDAEDVDGDGLPELFVTNYSGEYDVLYQNLGGGTFMDVTTLKGMGLVSVPWVGWGCALADFDGDGWPDCFVANAHVDDNIGLLGPASPYAQPALLYHNLAGKEFRPIEHGAGSYFESHHLGHGAAFGDLDDDGDIDIVVNHKDGPPALLRNDSPAGNRWIRIELVGTTSNRDAIGSVVEVVAGDRTIRRQRKGGSSLMSSHDPRILIGLGTPKAVARLTVRWPSGVTSVLENLETNRSHRIVEPDSRKALTRGAGR